MSSGITRYRIRIHGEECGPFSVPQLRRMVESGTASNQDLASLEGGTEWQPLALFLDLEAPFHRPRRIGRFPIVVLTLSVVTILALIGLSYTLSKRKKAMANAEAVNATEKTIHGVMGRLVTYRLLAGKFPSPEQGLQALVEEPSTPPLPRRWEPYLEELPIDAWGRPLLYRHDGNNPQSTPEVLSAGPDGIADTDDDVSCRKKEGEAE